MLKRWEWCWEHIWCLLHGSSDVDRADSAHQERQFNTAISIGQPKCLLKVLDKKQLTQRYVKALQWRNWPWLLRVHPHHIIKLKHEEVLPRELYWVWFLICLLKQTITIDSCLCKNRAHIINSWELLLTKKLQKKHKTWNQ